MVWKRITKTVLVLLSLVVATIAAGPLLITAADATEAPRIDNAQVAFAGEVNIETVSYDDAITLVGSYVVVDGRFENADPETLQAWESVVEVLPANYLAKIKQFSVFDEGPAGTVAMVHQSGTDRATWILSVDRADALDLDLLRETLLHELAHLVTLDATQFTFAGRSPAGAACDGVALPLGCAHEDSMLSSWTSQFWHDPAVASTFAADQFVATYAATSAHEDLAESFLYWAQGDVEAPTGSVLAAKFAWFDTQPELVAVRAALVAASI